ncbi:MAG: preprotein translocase subunit SecG [Candidatus Omnitrophota bacterium]
MYIFIIIIHVIVSILLIIAVLLQSGKGGGLIESFSAAESIFGTKTSTFMARATTILVTLFFITTLSLAFLSTQKSKSLVESSIKEESALPLGSSPPPATTPKETQTDKLTEPKTTETQEAVSKKGDIKESVPTADSTTQK